MLSAFGGRAVSGVCGLVHYFLGNRSLLFGEIFMGSSLLIYLYLCSSIDRITGERR